uniref:Elongation factor 1-beta n=1 Tax=Steinernema glaseri TaxID=37863 RepID=A0A1I7XWT9_9BILA
MLPFLIRRHTDNFKTQKDGTSVPGYESPSTSARNAIFSSPVLLQRWAFSAPTSTLLLYTRVDFYPVAKILLTAKLSDLVIASFFAEMVHNVSSDAGLAEFNTHLLNFSYASGFSPSGEDAELFASLQAAPCAKKYANVARWFKHIGVFSAEERKAWPKASTSEEPAAADDDLDLFGSDDEEDDEEKKRITEERLKAYAEKKSKKPGPIAKSNIIYDIKPWDDTVDLNELEKVVRAIEMDGLVWGASKILPIAYGINKLQICCVVEDLKVSSDALEEKITDNEDLVQSVDVVAFNKV